MVIFSFSKFLVLLFETKELCSPASSQTHDALTSAYQVVCTTMPCSPSKVYLSLLTWQLKISESSALS
jgi:hypothetical protein